MIRIAGATWTYPHATEPSLRGIDLHIAAGEFVVLCGASGSGKSTALRLMNGLIPHFHDEGTLTGAVTVDGLVTTEVELDEIGLRTGTVLQHPRRQFFADTAPEEIAFAMENFGVPPERIRGRVADAVGALAGQLPIERSCSTSPAASSNQVAIATTDAHEPGILLLDEPSSNLSARRGQLVRTLRELKGQGDHRRRRAPAALPRRPAGSRRRRAGRGDRPGWSATQFHRPRQGSAGRSPRRHPSTERTVPGHRCERRFPGRGVGWPGDGAGTRSRALQPRRAPGTRHRPGRLPRGEA
ncbi:MAG: ABC transporter ATP-binding protein [Micropruina sp.]